MDPAKGLRIDQGETVGMNANPNPVDLQTSPRQDSANRIYGVVLSVGVLCSLAIVTTYEITRPIIARNKITQRRQAILDVLPQASSIAAYAFDSSTGNFVPVPEESEDADLVFAGFGKSGELVGLAIGAQGMGYQDTIQLLYGYNPATESVIGIRVLESRETPGLGDRVEKDPDYLRNFEQLDVRVSDDGERLEHEIAFVKSGEKKELWQIDGITGATISSRAVAEMLQRSTNDWVPRIRRNQAEFRASASGDPSS